MIGAPMTYIMCLTLNITFHAGLAPYTALITLL
jgi:hypothetical protein